MKVKLANVAPLTEIYKTPRVLQYSLIDKDGMGLHPPVKCKDFISTILWAERTGNDINMMGMVHRKGTIDLNTNLIAISVSEETLNNTQVDNVRKALSFFEEKYGWEKSSVELSDDASAIVVNYNSRWADSPIAISLMTFIIRVGFARDDDYNTIEEFCKSKQSVYGPADSYRLMLPPSGFGNKIITYYNVGLPKQTFEQFTLNSDVHTRSGIMDYWNKACW